MNTLMSISCSYLLIFILYILLYYTVIAQPQFHFITHSCIDGSQDIRALRAVNLLLKSRSKVGGQIAAIPCTWVIFGQYNADTESWKIVQLQVIANDSHCNMVIFNEKCQSVGLMAAKAVIQVSSSSQNVQIIYMNPNTIVVDDLFMYINPKLKASGMREIVGFIPKILPVPQGYQCELSVSILPSFRIAGDMIYNNKNDLCKILEDLTGENEMFLNWELPLEVRFEVNRDDSLPYTENIAVLVTSSNTGVDLEYTLFDKGRDPDFTVYDFQYYCKLQLLGPWETLQGPSSFSNALKKHFSFPLNKFCVEIFGRMLVSPEGYEMQGSCGNPINSWLIDYETCKASDNAFWNGTLSQFNETVQVASTPKLFYASDRIKSNCTVALFAVGEKYLLNAFLQAKRFKDLQSRADDSFCRGINIAIYTDEETINHFEKLEGIDSVDYLFSIPEISSISTHSDEQILNALSNAAQTMQHFPSLYWKRIFMLLHPPTKFMMYIDNEVFPCQIGFDSIFQNLQVYDIVSFIEEFQEYGNTYDDKRFPYPPSGLSLDWIQTYERAMGFLMIDTSKTVIREAIQKMYEAFGRHMDGILTGTLITRGEQTAFREAMFHVSKYINEKMTTVGSSDQFFCSRPFQFNFERCILYHAYDAYSKCLNISY